MGGLRSQGGEGGEGWIHDQVGGGSKIYVLCPMEVYSAPWKCAVQHLVNPPNPLNTLGLADALPIAVVRRPLVVSL